MNSACVCLFAVVSLVLTAGCDSDGDGGGGSGGAASCPPFTKITGKSFAAEADTLTWTLTVEELPSELPFNRAEVPLDVLEYQWAVGIDPEGDGTEDYRVAVTNYAHDEAVTGDILSNTQHDLYEVTETTGLVVGDIAATISGTTFTFALDLTENPGLPAIGGTSGHRFLTQYYTGTEICGDESKGL